MAEFEGIERKRSRFAVKPIFDRDVKLRMKFEVGEFGFLQKQLDLFTSLAQKINRKATPTEIKAYKDAASAIIPLLIVDKDDQEYVERLINPEPDDEDLMDIFDVMSLVSGCLNLDDKEAEEETGKVSDGSIG